MRAFMRCLGSDETPLDLVDLNPEVACVEVPGFGHLIVALDPDHPNGSRAVLTAGPGTERTKEVTRVDGRIECELLHKANRLCVVIDPEAEP